MYVHTAQIPDKYALPSRAPCDSLTACNADVLASTVAPPQQSPEEIRAMEAEATFTVQQVAATAFMLYLCMSCACSMERGRTKRPVSLVASSCLVCALANLGNSSLRRRHDQPHLLNPARKKKFVYRRFHVTYIHAFHSGTLPLTDSAPVFLTGETV